MGADTSVPVRMYDGVAKSTLVAPAFAVRERERRDKEEREKEKRDENPNAPSTRSCTKCIIVKLSRSIYFPATLFSSFVLRISHAIFRSIRVKTEGGGERAINSSLSQLLFGTL